MGATENHLLTPLSYRRGRPSSYLGVPSVGPEEVSQLPHSFIHSLTHSLRVMSFIHSLVKGQGVELVRRFQVLDLVAGFP